MQIPILWVRNEKKATSPIAAISMIRFFSPFLSRGAWWFLCFVMGTGQNNIRLETKNDKDIGEI